MRTWMCATLAVAVASSLLACGSDDSGGGAGAGGSAGSAGGGIGGGGSGGGGDGSCTASSPAPGVATKSCDIAALKICQDYTGTGWTAEQIHQVCDAYSGTVADAACKTAGVTGKCQVTCGASQEFVQLAYDATAMDQSMCEAKLHGKWLEN